MAARRLLPVVLVIAGALLVLTAGALSFGLLPFGHATPPGPAEESPGRVAGPDDAGPLVVQEPDVDLGAVKAPVQHTFRYTNTGSRPLKITSISRSCSCIASKPDRKLLQPGEEGSVGLEADVTKKEPGAHRFNITIEYDCAGRRFATASMRVTYQPDLHLFPKALDLTVTEGGQAAATFALVDYRPEPLQVLRAGSASPAVQVRVSERPGEYLPGWRYVLEVRYADPAAETRGSLATEVFLETSDPAHPRFSVPVLVRRLERLRLAPAAVSFAPGGTAAVVVRDSQGEPVEVEGCETDGLVRATFLPGAEPVKRVTLTFADTKPRPEKGPTTIWIKVKAPCQRRLPVKVLAASSSR